MKIKILILLLMSTSVLSQELSREQLIIAKTILGEARGEGESGMYAVACVIQQRVLNRKIPADKVCLQKNQFSCWNKNDPNRNKLDRLLLIPQADYAKRLAVNLDKLSLKYIKKSDHYCSKVLWKTNPPKWLKNKKPVAVIGRHVFFRLKND